jgi:hypothetical protein
VEGVVGELTYQQGELREDEGVWRGGRVARSAVAVQGEWRVGGYEGVVRVQQEEWGGVCAARSAVAM